MEASLFVRPYIAASTMIAAQAKLFKYTAEHVSKLKFASFVWILIISCYFVYYIAEDEGRHEWR
jgi:hypothetical protein